jgi:hypothetical protein
MAKTDDSALPEDEIMAGDAYMNKFGPWKPTKGKIMGLRNTLERQSVQILMKVGLLGERILVEHIRRQDLPWEALDPAYAAWKARMGYSEKKWIMTSSLFQSITSWMISRSQVVVGVKKGVRIGKELYPEPGKIIGRLEKMRPLFGPSLDDLKARAPGVIEGELQ